MSTEAKEREINEQISSLMRARLLGEISKEQYNIAALELEKQFSELKEGKVA